MIGIFYFYLSRTLKNQVAARLRRLKQPKYLVSAIVGLGYLGLVFFPQFFSRPRRHGAAAAALDVNMLALMEAGFALLLLGIVLIPWISPGKGAGGLRFTEAEIQFLFPAPVSRRALLHFYLIKMQLGILLGVVISSLVFGRGRFSEHPAFFLVTLWIVYSFLALYFVGTTLTRTSLAEHGASGFKRQAWVLALLAAVFIAIVIWVKWFIPASPEIGRDAAEALPAWFLRVTASGPAYFFLAPFRALVRPAFASDPGIFLVRLVPALAILGLVYLWVMRADVSFEEAAAERARKTADRLAAARGGAAVRGPRTGTGMRRPIFRLSPEGPAHIAILWKNLISIGRLGSIRIVPAILVVGIGLAVIFAGRGGQQHVVPTIIGSLSAVMAGFLTLVGPMLIRDDLRCDLLNIDVLKTYPIPGWSLVLGEALAPASVLAVAEWTLLLLAALFLPGVGRLHPSIQQRLLVALSAACLLPCISLLGVLIQNAAVLILPGWAQLGKDRRRGIEAMGQRLITMAATVLVLVFAEVPAALLFLAVFFLGSLLVGIAILPVAALLASLVLLAEAGVAVYWLGLVYDRFDASVEGAGR